MKSELRVYKRLPEWSAQTLPAGFQRQHNTQEGTWARLVIYAGALRFTFLSEEGEALSSQILDAESGPQIVEPGVWHKVEPVDDGLRCQLSFLCTPDRYMEKRYGLTAPHSEVRDLLPRLAASPGRSVLDLGCGRGRNSLFLAERGFDVIAVDKSEPAVTTLREIQAAEGIECATAIYDINDAALASALPEGAVDHVISTVVFQFLDPARVAAVIQDLQAVTRPGGIHLIVAPMTSAEVPCPLPLPCLFEPGALKARYAGWVVERYTEALGEFHKRDAQGARHRALFCTLVARKPAA